jgi:hypothetical protein
VTYQNRKAVAESLKNLGMGLIVSAVTVAMVEERKGFGAAVLLLGGAGLYWVGFWKEQAI